MGEPGVRTLDVVGQTAAALAAAHAAGVVHRDVKPGNVLVGTDGVVRITDFGIAWSASSVPLTRTGQVVGTAHYLSPEQAAGEKAGPASDVYALGAIAYECLAGRRAFDGESPVQIALAQIRDEPEPLPDDVPAPVRTLVARAMVKDPAQRFPDGAALRAAVDDVRAGRPLAPLLAATAPLPVAASPAPARSVPAPSSRVLAAGRRRHRALVPVATLLAGAGLGVAVLQLAGGGQAATPATVADTGAPAAEPVDDVLVAAVDHLGRPVDEVEAALAALSLRVQRVTEGRSDVPAGQVTGIGPVGALFPGDLVTITVAVAPPPAPVAPGSVVEPPATAAPQPAAPPAPAPVPVDDEQDADVQGSEPGRPAGRR